MARLSTYVVGNPVITICLSRLARLVATVIVLILATGGKDHENRRRHRFLP